VRLKLLLAIVIPALFFACAEKEFDPNDAEKSYGIAKEPYDDANYEIAITKLGEFKSRFPYSKYAVEAELLLANAQYELGHYTEAAVAYEQFVKLHPKHPKIDYAYFRIGESYWEDAPEEIDREQEYTTKAIKEWEKLVEKLPDSPYSKKAADLIQKGKRRIAESIAFIYQFYCRQGISHACAYRAIQLADEFPEFPELRIEALEHAISSLEKVAKAKEADPTSDKNLYFKTMSAAEIRARADGFKKLLADYKKSVNVKQN
jgi:outer membrane protein assembly factor BamD